MEGRSGGGGGKGKGRLLEGVAVTVAGDHWSLTREHVTGYEADGRQIGRLSRYVNEASTALGPLALNPKPTHLAERTHEHSHHLTLAQPCNQPGLPHAGSKSIALMLLLLLLVGLLLLLVGLLLLLVGLLLAPVQRLCGG